MPTLDFTDVFEDEDLASSFSVLRRNETVNADTGRGVVAAPQVISGLVGTITNGEPGQNKRDDDGQSSTWVITVITKFRLRAASPGVQPDIVVFQGQQFTVKSLDRWTQFGAGFVVGICEHMEASTPPAV